MDGLWTDHEENTALLLEHFSHEVGLDWSDRTVDPDDPDVAARREEAEVRGLKPPTVPLIPPMAHRPLRAARRRMERFVRDIEPYAELDHDDDPEVDVDVDEVLDEFMAQYA